MDGGVTMAGRPKFTVDEARAIGSQLGIDWAKAPFTAESYAAGMNIELEHGARDPETNVTNDDPTTTGKIALAHLKEYPDYYERLDKLETEADAYWSAKKG
jgi:hypothetical protein